MRGLIGKKIGMTQVFTQIGDTVPVTVLEVGPCVVTQVKNEKSDGYNAVQIGFGEKKKKHSNNPLNGHFDKAGTTPKKLLFEFEPIAGVNYKTGQIFKADLFREGDIVTVSGISKGKGFAGVMKRHGFAGGPKTHGQREHPRSAGSIGQASYPSRVFKGMKMAGQMGNKKSTTQNLEIIQVNVDSNQIAVKGAVPGGKNGYITISK
ncbi:MAG: 50S ribosomal protein L3 [Candidatus Marinimicrobia bacterium]|jgi:large subunit ribosomal protein L3|nr:50S ribosomal protein L3 [Candidatus Neomarinimicrobiota bacterium]MBT3617234.1 50S ribosomal protein L3 [Candidatus Neomarinimicrobiota bacterium]MBT3829729.1 50S ribosomal protein L3 [Candidatus Neomarinimicrobiota bacterium]MBT3997924.1 50S ribosomal protein L3 [Candidatus Neomarinimicrobiota bacterium]MBT4281302.1 50S ribosomal protein L3 [Candidatus Neomarinimicrobiota bacterium]